MAAFIAPLIGGLAGLFGGGQQQKQQTSGTITNQNQGTQTQQGTQQGTSTSSGTTQTQGNQAVTHKLSPFQQQLAGIFSQGAANQYKKGTDLSGYTQGGLQNINTGSDLASKVIANNFASRGLSYSPAAANAQTQNDLSRISQGNQFLSQVPLVQHQLQNQDLSQVMQAFGMLPTDTNTATTGSGSTQNNASQSQTSDITGSSTQSGTQTQQGTNLVSGNQLGGLFSGIGQGLFAPVNNQGDTALSSILKLFGGGN